MVYVENQNGNSEKMIETSTQGSVHNRSKISYKLHNSTFNSKQMDSKNVQKTFPKSFKMIFSCYEGKNAPSQQLFIVDESGLFWNRIA